MLLFVLVIHLNKLPSEIASDAHDQEVLHLMGPRVESSTTSENKSGPFVWGENSTCTLIGKSYNYIRNLITVCVRTF